MGDRPRITACIIVKDEEKRIKGCLESIRNYVDEIIVVDGYSEDRTVEICREFTDKIYKRSPKGYMEADITFALKKTSHKWVLFIDADERISKKLAQNLKAILKIGEKKDYNGFLVNKETHIQGRERIKDRTKGTGVPRIFQKDAVSWKGVIHEKPKIEGKTRKLPRKYSLVHYPSRYHTSYDKAYKKNIRYLKFEIEKSEKVHSTLFYLLKAFINFPLGFFIQLFFYKRILNGYFGLHKSLLKSISRFTINIFTAYSDLKHPSYLTDHWIFKALALFFTIEGVLWYLSKSPKW